MPFPAPHRLVPQPTFLLTSIRSGSTLLRCILDTHTRICAPHELHLRDLRVNVTSTYAHIALDTMALPVTEVEHLLWDRMLHRILAASGKEVIVDKTPSNLLDWPRLAECWPKARFVFLIRHPLHVIESAIAASPGRAPRDTTSIALEFLDALDDARRHLDGITVRYEDLTTDPAGVTVRLCDHLGVPWEEEMLDYGVVDHGPFKHGIGDFTQKITAGHVLPGRPLPDPGAIPASLIDRCERWGYL